MVGLIWIMKIVLIKQFPFVLYFYFLVRVRIRIRKHYFWEPDPRGLLVRIGADPDPKTVSFGSENQIHFLQFSIFIILGKHFMILR
jgi:hypothetical protein